MDELACAPWTGERVKQRLRRDGGKKPS
jgi:hypothetical protein